MRFWLSGPRVLGIRPGISFRPDELLREPARAQPSQGGFIYIISNNDGFLKIGISSDPNARLAQLRTASASPLAIEYAGALRCEGFEIEAAAHKTLAKYRMKGEWFDCPVDMAVAAIGAAAHSLGEPIASVEPSKIRAVVRAVALSNQIVPTKPRQEPTSSRALRWICIFIFFLFIAFIVF